MNRETIIQMAREAGLAEVTDTAESLPADYVEALAKLCALVAAKERDECAKWYAEEGWLLDEEDVPAAIRARGEATDQAAPTEPGHKWECFIDPSYFDMWAVKQISNQRFDEAYHVTSDVEARRLCAVLNSIETSKRTLQVDPSRRGVK